MNSLGITGHRPDKLDGYNIHTPYYINMLNDFQNFFRDNDVHKVYSGMALGVDTIAALAVIQLKRLDYDIQLIACIPCRNHSYNWPYNSRKMYDEILNEADEVVLVTDAVYSPHLMQLRNRYIVDHVEHMLAVYDGSAGGTANCVKYAISKDIPITVWDPSKFY